MSRIQIITAAPQNVRQGSGCYVGTSTLTRALQRMGTDVDMVTPRVWTPVYAATRILFNETLRWRGFDCDATIGIDADGYTMAGRGRGRWNAVPHIACIKGVLGDAVRFERGATRASLAIQARLEARHAQRADLVITISDYCAQRLEQLYGVPNAVVVPELIDLEAWRARFERNPDTPEPGKFTVLSVCRFYPRKRLDILLRAVALLADRIRDLEVRIPGNGPEGGRLRRLASELRIERFITWVGDASVDELAREYNRADVFCLPSVQEGFGIVFLEAMAAGKPIVAAHAAAVPEVVRNGVLVEPDNAEALANALILFDRDPGLRQVLGEAGARHVKEFEMQRVARQFLAAVARVAPGVASEENEEIAYAN